MRLPCRNYGRWGTCNMSTPLTTQPDQGPALHVVIVGHIDHGKSTLIGRLLHDTHALPIGKLEEIQAAAERQGVRWEFAHILDHFAEEREKGITIDSAQMQFRHRDRTYVIIDAPGHREFLGNMVTGSSQAEAALVLVDVTQGIQPQTWRHCYILGLLGIRSIAVLINKMDLVGYSEDAFNRMKQDVEQVLSACGVTAQEVIPIAARLGENLTQRADTMPWYQGPTVLDALGHFQSAQVVREELRVPIQDVYDVDGQPMAVGRIESGVLRAGRSLWVMPEGRPLSPSWAIRKYLQPPLAEAQQGDCIGIHVADSQLRRGQMIVDREAVACRDRIRASVLWLANRPGRVGDRAVWKGTTQEVPAQLTRIVKRFDPAEMAVVESNAAEIGPSEVAEVELLLAHPVVADAFGQIPQTGRFTLEMDGEPIAGGVVLAGE